jgi:hypothetical protein
VDKEIAEKAAECRSKIRMPDGKWLALADSIILATSILEGAEILYTIDTNFANVEEVKVKAPGSNNTGQRIDKTLRNSKYLKTKSNSYLYIGTAKKLCS